MKRLSLVLLLLGSSALAAQDVVVCKGKAVTGESFELSFCSELKKETRDLCEGQGVEITVNGKSERGYYPVEMYLHAEGDRFVVGMKSMDDGLNRYAEIEYTTAHTKRWNLIRFRLIGANPQSDEQLEKTYFTATDFTCDLKP